MKKIAITLMVCVFATAIFAQQADKAENIKKLLNLPNDSSFLIGMKKVISDIVNLPGGNLNPEFVKLLNDPAFMNEVIKSYKYQQDTMMYSFYNKNFTGEEISQLLVIFLNPVYQKYQKLNLNIIVNSKKDPTMDEMLIRNELMKHLEQVKYMNSRH
jgi:hypothetical protein